MDKKTSTIWTAILLTLTLTTLWFTWTAARDLYSYYSLSATSTAVVSDTEIITLGEDTYSVQLEYAFTYMNDLHYGKTDTEDYLYRNLWSAKNAEDHLRENHLTAWFNPHNPDLSTLRNDFPYKSTLYALILIGLTLYFLFFLRFALVQISGDKT